MCEKLLAILTILLVAFGNPQDAACLSASPIHSESGGEFGCALSLLQKAAVSEIKSTALPDAHEVCARINARFGSGRPSKKLDEAGVVVHAFDGDILPPGAVDEDGMFASLDHWSASVINARVPQMYLGHPEDDLHSKHAGFVISPTSAAANLLCSYDHDGWTMTLNPCTPFTSGCVPGCIGWRNLAPPDTIRLTRQWCSINTTEQTSINRVATDTSVDAHCAWPPDALDAMMREQEVQAAEMFEIPYNEIVLNRDTLEGMLPKPIEAIYFVTGSAALTPRHAAEGERQAKAAQRFLWKEHGRHVPLVRVKNLSAQMPFELVSETSD
mmetsp:Transcript_56430/g.101148  ORF Transcript_56430/g.101148 Transcript_56430/m.101148 type:complete len:327 (+) Transcript_56430:61-1041(+)